MKDLVVLKTQPSRMYIEVLFAPSFRAGGFVNYRFSARANFAKNVNQVIDLAVQSKKDLIFMTNDIIFTNEWAKPLLQNSESISIP